MIYPYYNFINALNKWISKKSAIYHELILGLKNKSKSRLINRGNCFKERGNLKANLNGELIWFLIRDAKDLKSDWYNLGLLKLNFWNQK